MECPKCKHIQENTVECESCGIIFAKYAEFQKRQEEAEIYQDVENKKSSHLKFLIIVTAVSIIGYLFYPSADKDAPSNTTAIPAQENNETESDNASAEAADPNSIRLMLLSSNTPRNKIENADNATVFIKTSWGTGSGFFIDSQCHIITNRHVVEVDQEQLEQVGKASEILEARIERYKKSLKELRSRTHAITSRRAEKALKSQIEYYEALIEKSTEEYNTLVEGLDRAGDGSITFNTDIELVDGSVYPVTSYELSDDNDLAVLKIDGTDCPYLEPDFSDNLELGKKVYTIGNPVGFQHTVTSGIISGYQVLDGKRVIQTDAPINRGNSGGPLISAEGTLLGINTMIAVQTEGIGFAIPINVVFEDFNFLK